jgi:uracil-DNA glycosylase family 4
VSTVTQPTEPTEPTEPVEPALVAPGAPTWRELSELVTGCVACAELAASRQCVVVGEAPAGARLALVGEAPGAQEDAAGRPFVGRAGQLLDTVLAEVGLPRAEIAVLNALKCRPPGNRTPRPAELARCRPWLTRQLELVSPALVVPLGLTATTWFLGRKITLGAVRGRVHEVDGRRVVPTYHPSAAIRFGPGGAPMAALREDLAFVAATLAGEA